jgi:uncharacterized protein
LKFQYTHLMGLPRKVAWKWIRSDKVIRNSITGCKSFYEIASGVYHGEIEFHVGPIRDTFTLEIRRIQEKMPSFLLVEVKGRGKLGEAQGEAEVLLNDMEGATKLTVHADFELTGTLSLVGDRLASGEANKVIENFLKRLEREMKKEIYQARKKN